jgi:ElaB/YqjD/DUF883 family membrane-anchored ribosome-binding protein
MPTKDRYELQARPAAPLVRSRQERSRRRLAGSRQRLVAAVERVRAATRELTPAARIAEQPMTWVFRALVVGLAIGLLTARRRRR